MIAEFRQLQFTVLAWDISEKFRTENASLFPHAKAVNSNEEGRVRFGSHFQYD